MAPADTFSQEIPALEFDNGPAVLIEQVQSLTVADIDDSGRLRLVDSVAAQAIAASMARDGLLNPIDVCRLPGQTGYRLVAGGHRLAAARLLGWATITGFVRSNDALDRKAREVAENLFKADLGPLERSAFVAELHQIEKARAGLSANDDGRKAGANVRWQKELKNQATDANDTMSFAYGFTAEVAAKVGLDIRTIQRDLLLFKRLSPALVARVRKLPIGTNAAALRTLAAQGFAVQDQAVTLMEQGRAAKIGQALAIIDRKPVPDASAKRLSTFLDTFGRMGLREQKDALQLLQARLPDSLAFTFKNDPAEKTAVPVMDPKPHKPKGVR